MVLRQAPAPTSEAKRPLMLPRSLDFTHPLTRLLPGPLTTRSRRVRSSRAPPLVGDRGHRRPCKVQVWRRRHSDGCRCSTSVRTSSKRRRSGGTRILPRTLTVRRRPLWPLTCRSSRTDSAIQPVGPATNTGISRSVLSWSAATGGNASTARCHHSTRSSPETTRATAAMGSGPSWMVMFGSATRL